MVTQASLTTLHRYVQFFVSTAENHFDDLFHLTTCVANQAWNHDFYWKCMRPGGGGAATGAIGEQIVKDFGSFDEFRKQFESAGNTAFGSGWCSSRISRSLALARQLTHTAQTRQTLEGRGRGRV